MINNQREVIVSALCTLVSGKPLFPGWMKLPAGSVVAAFKHLRGVQVRVEVCFVVRASGNIHDKMVASPKERRISGCQRGERYVPFSGWGMIYNNSL